MRAINRAASWVQGSFVQPWFVDVIEDISVETHSQQGDVIGQFCIHEMEVGALAERVSELCM